MGASKSNPLAEDFRGFSAGGPPPPPVVIAAQLVAKVEPSKEWMQENAIELFTAQKEKLPPPQCPSDRADVVFYISGQMMIPKLTAKNPSDWPYGDGLVAEVHRMPWPKYNALLIAQNPHLANEVAPAIVMTGGN